jgi:trans-aconitate methyltransferase
MSDRSFQKWNPESYATQVRFVSDLGLPVVDLLAPRKGERILDLGCGDGVLSERLAGFGCQVVGVDASPEMVAAAKARGVQAHVTSGEALRFDQEFDAVFSNAALHWMTNPTEVIAGVWRALKPGGRFVGEFGGQGNIAAIVGALESALVRRGLTAPHPWYFPSAQEYRRLLDAQGFSVRSLSLFERPTPLPHGMTAWLTIFVQPFLDPIPEGKRSGFLSEVIESLRPRLCDAAGTWTADYVRLRFAAVKPA